MGYKEQFIEIFTDNIKRDGGQNLLEWMQKTDFFTAPASTKFHGACEEGLVMHSINVYNTMMERHFDPDTDNRESFAICGLLHDLFPLRPRRGVFAPKRLAFQKITVIDLSHGFIEFVRFHTR